MALVESVGSELLPVGPYLFKYLGVMSVGLSPLKEQGLQGVHLVNKFLTHSLAQRVTLAACEVGQQARQKHDLFLIDGYSISVLQILLHHWDIVDNRSLPMLTGNELRNIVHGTRTVEGVHGYKVLESGGLQFAQVFLHAG